MSNSGVSKDQLPSSENLKVQEPRESITTEGFYKASTHERTTDLECLNPQLKKTNINVPVEEELVEFRQEIEQKFALAEMKDYRMQRQDPDEGTH